LLTGGGMSLALLELVDGAEVQSPGTSPGTELLYFISGGGSIKLAGETSLLTAESLVHVPRGMPYVIKAAAAETGERVLVAQLWVTSPPRTGAVPAAPQAPLR